MDDLRAYGVPVLILSGGEPLMRPDIFEISRRAKDLGFYVGLSTNGTLIDEDNIEDIAAVGYDYLGISIDGIEETHDQFRRREGAFAEAMQGIGLARDQGIKVGLRFTLTQDNARELPQLLDLMDEEGIDKFYLSHLNYAGRGNRNRGSDVVHRTTRWAMELLFERCWDELERGVKREYVTGNNDADGVFLMHWVQARFPDRSERLRTLLERWGGKLLRNQHRQHRQSGRRAPRHVLVESYAGQRSQPAVLRNLGGPFRPDPGWPEAEAPASGGPLRPMCVSLYLRGEHPHPRIPNHWKSMGRGSSMLSDGCGDRSAGGARHRAPSGPSAASGHCADGRGSRTRSLGVRSWIIFRFFWISRVGAVSWWALGAPRHPRRSYSSMREHG